MWTWKRPRRWLLLVSSQNSSPVLILHTKILTSPEFLEFINDFKNYFQSLGEMFHVRLKKCGEKKLNMKGKHCLHVACTYLLGKESKNVLKKLRFLETSLQASRTCPQSSFVFRRRRFLKIVRLKERNNKPRLHQANERQRTWTNKNIRSIWTSKRRRMNMLARFREKSVYQRMFTFVQLR